MFDEAWVVLSLLQYSSSSHNFQIWPNERLSGRGEHLVHEVSFGRDLVAFGERNLAQFMHQNCSVDVMQPFRNPALAGWLALGGLCTNHVNAE